MRAVAVAKCAVMPQEHCSRFRVHALRACPGMTVLCCKTAQPGARGATRELSMAAFCRASRGSFLAASGSVAGFAGDIGVVLTKQDISTILQCGPSRPGKT